jgi:hypothetical protein
MCNENLAARIIVYSCGIVIVRTKGNSVDCLVSFQLQFDHGGSEGGLFGSGTINPEITVCTRGDSYALRDTVSF